MHLQNDAWGALTPKQRTERIARLSTPTYASLCGMQLAAARPGGQWRHLTPADQNPIHFATVITITMPMISAMATANDSRKAVFRTFPQLEHLNALELV